MPPCRRQVGASLRRPQRSERYIASFSESSFCAKSHTGGFWGAVGPLALALWETRGDNSSGAVLGLVMSASLRR